MRIIYSGRFTCVQCNHEQRFDVLGTEVIHDPAFAEDALEYAVHDHWTKIHRVCAVCGVQVGREDLELAVNDGSIQVHKDYTHDYGTKVRSGDMSFCLIVHKRCVEEEHIA